jgi:hypothetical protein
MDNIVELIKNALTDEDSQVAGVVKSLLGDKYDLLKDYMGGDFDVSNLTEKLSSFLNEHEDIKEKISGLTDQSDLIEGLLKGETDAGDVLGKLASNFDAGSLLKSLF